MINYSLIFLWMAAHVCGLLSIFCRNSLTRSSYAFVGILIISYILLFKPLTYDLPVYINFFENPYPTDIGFNFITNLLIRVGFAANGALVVCQFLIFFLILLGCYSESYKNNFLLVVLVILGSVFFIIASQNIIRQGISISLAIIGCNQLFKKNNINIFNSVFFAFSILIHFWTIIFVIIILICFFYNNFMKIKYLNNFFCGMLIGLVAMTLVNYVGASENYLNGHSDWEVNRVSVYLKIVPYGVMFLIINFLIAREFSQNLFLKRIYLIRCMIFGFSFPFLIYAEIFSRIIVFFYAIELLMMISMIHLNSYRVKLAFVTIFSAYAIAINVWNIISFEFNY